MEAFTNAMIVAMCYVVGHCIKQTEKVDNKYIPSIVTTTGAIIGVVFYCVGVVSLNADNWAVALVMGAISGFAPTGVNEFTRRLKDLSKGDEEE